VKTDQTAHSALGIIKQKGGFGKRAQIGEPFDYPGLQILGWWPHLPCEPACLLDAGNFWSTAKTELLAERDRTEDADGRLRQNALCVRIYEFPPDESSWMAAVGQTLRLFVKCGAAIAWAGGYTCFGHYSQTEKMIGCYAAYTEGTGLICPSGLDAPLRFLDEQPDLVKKLHRAVRTAILNGGNH
jgi:hypothetical protein